MNDRFKFRVWDNAEKKYNGFSFHLARSGKLDRLSVDGGLIETDEERFVIEQCTGLRDKNRTLIYEGDIVLINKRWKKVYWFNGAFFCDDIREYEFNGKDPAALHYWLANGYDIEIIGNIHEENRTNKTDKY